MKEKDGKFIFGPAKVGEKGQIVIPKQAREVFNIKSGDTLVVLGDINEGLAIMTQERFNEVFYELLESKKKGK